MSGITQTRTTQNHFFRTWWISHIESALARHLPSYRHAAAVTVSLVWISSYPCSACFGTRLEWPAGSGLSSPPAAPSWAHLVAGLRCSTSVKCGAAFRSAPSSLEWSFPIACARGSDEEFVGPTPDQLKTENHGKNEQKIRGDVRKI